ncbi:zona pellucida-like domain protein [Ostertagia ostertagi]
MLRLLTSLGLIALVAAIPVDNGVEGEPEIECGPTSVTVNFNTRNPFEGHVYVKGLFDHDECRNNDSGRQVAGIELPFDSCNVARTRSLNPRGVRHHNCCGLISISVCDQSDGCFYMEADKTVSTQIEVSDLTTAFQTQIVPMPVCKYEILNGGPTGEPVQFATIGQQVYHKWTCDSETIDTFCAVVHTCTVDDGNGDTVQILDENGCALDKFLLNNLEYPTDLMAGQEAHVYKYADRSQLFYQCQISISIKEPNAECARPQCAEPKAFGAVKQEQQAQFFRVLKKRSTITALENVMDVRAEITALEVLDGELPALPQAARLTADPTLISLPSEGVCMSLHVMSVMVSGLVFLMILAVVCTALCLRVKKY